MVQINLIQDDIQNSKESIFYVISKTCSWGRSFSEEIRMKFFIPEPHRRLEPGTLVSFQKNDQWFYQLIIDRGYAKGTLSYQISRGLFSLRIKMASLK